MPTTPVSFIGVDVSKTPLESVVWGDPQGQQVNNAPDGVATLLTQVTQLPTPRVVVEATGVYEQLLVQSLLLRGIAVAVANPTRVPWPKPRANWPKPTSLTPA